MTERELQDALITLGRLRGFLVYHTHDSRRSEPGFPDLVFARADQIIFAEIKSASGRLTAEQATWIETLTAAGQQVYVWRPDDYDTAIALLNAPRLAGARR